MNRKQEYCLLLGIIAVIVMGIYPPWLFNDVLFGAQVHYDEGYNWLWAYPPSFPWGAFLNPVEVNLIRLCSQCAVVAVIMGALIVTLKKKRNGEEQNQ